ncbi:hypothetical protein MASR1M45_01220 [Candidatus Kapaibacterium sp.]
MNEEIRKLRAEIDNIDKNIIDLLTFRKELSDKIISEKKCNNISVYDRQRELEIVDKLKSEFSQNINPQLIEGVFREILFYSKVDNYRINTNNKLFEVLNSEPFIIAGPCTIESEEQLCNIANHLSKSGIKLLRGGAFKPRTSPFSFQGMEDEGLALMKKIADKYSMYTVSEFTDSRQLNELYDLVDVIQIGSRNMFSYGFLKQIGQRTAQDKKPVLLKRGFQSTVNEFLLSAQYIINEGNPNVILCLRGIRTFEQIDSDLRNTPDLATILELKEKTNLKIVFDPSHACGRSKYVVKTSIAALELGADGLIIETHNKPEEALSDGKQSIKPIELERIIDYINKYF